MRALKKSTTPARAIREGFAEEAVSKLEHAGCVVCQRGGGKNVQDHVPKLKGELKKWNL